MRIRKRYQSPLPPPDLSSHIPPSMAATAAVAAAEVAAPTVAAAGGATGGKGGEATAAAGSRASGSRHGGGGGGGRGLHSNGRPSNPTPCPPFDAPPSGAAAERGDLPGGGAPLPTTGDVLVYRGHGRQAPKQEQDGETDGGDAHGCGGTGTAPAPKSLGAKACQVPVGHGGHRVPPRGATAALAAAQVMVRWSDGEGRLPPNKRGRYLAARGRSWGLDEAETEEENMVADREMEQRRPSNSRRRRTAASSTPTVAAPAGTALTSAGSTGNIGVAPTATGDGAGDDVVVKEEGGGDVVPATAASTLGDGNRGSGNGKKRRSPAVLMEGSRCSRVNGRGWRCCQQTLVGYSLCEHHLGKGRLRSVSSVRCNGRARKKEDVDAAALPPAPSLQQQQDQPLSGDGEEDEEEEEKPGKRKWNKIGMVKARSISSLLHQPAHSTPATIAAPEPFTSPSPTPATCPVTAAAPPPYGTD